MTKKTKLEKMQELKQQQMEKEQNQKYVAMTEKLKNIFAMEYRKNQCEILKKAREAKARKRKMQKEMKEVENV